MGSVVKGRWFFLISWVVLTIMLMITAPNMGMLVREKGQITVPEGYPSSIAEDILKGKEEEQIDNLSIVMVFHNENGLTEEEQREISAAIDLLNKDSAHIGISNILSHFEEPELQDQMLSKDQKTIFALVEVNKAGREIAEIRNSLDEALADVRVDHYFTSGELIDEDVIISSENGLRKTELITIAFILVILTLVFRSIVAPIIPLFTVGVSYLVSQSIVAFLVDGVNFPLSNFTQIFLVAVLFGIGTDYCLLLLSRFKEELSQGNNLLDAIVETYRTAGRTVFFSALAVFIGFSSIGFASFKLYQSAAGVAIGIVVLVLVLFTLVPFFMAVLGKKLFWPGKGALEHKESKIWGVTGRFSLARPLQSLLIVGVITIPLLLSYSGDRSFNSLNEISDEFDSVKGFKIMEESFGPGELMPITLVLESADRLDDSESLAIIEQISREVVKLSNVEKVRSATRPLGEVIEEFQVTQQVDTLSQGLNEGTEAIIQIRDGLLQIYTGLQDSTELQQAVDGFEQLIQATEELKDGVLSLNDGLIQIEKGLQTGATSAGELATGLEELSRQADELAVGGNELLKGYTTMVGGLTQLEEHYKNLDKELTSLSQVFLSLDSSIANLQERYPDLSKDADFFTLVETISKARGGVGALSVGLAQLNSELNQLLNGVVEANKGLEQVALGQQGFAYGLSQFQNGMDELKVGLFAMAAGQSEIISHVPQLGKGMEQVGAGQEELAQGFGQLANELQKLNDGLGASADGLTQIADGLGSAKDYLQDLSSSPDKGMAGWNIPQEVLGNEDFQKVFATYFSKDHKVTTLDIILNINPYANEALETVPLVEEAVKRVLAGTKLEQVNMGIGGVSSTLSDLKNVSDVDFIWTVTIMLIGLFIILIILLRSLIMPIYLIASLIVCYFTSLAVTELIFTNLLGYDAVNWAVPFFSFVILISLGVDYCIFLMDRFREYHDQPIESAILLAMKNMGTVIVSAVIILSGTFAAMMPSGVLSLLQIATTILSGLLLYALLFLPFFIPVMVKTFGKANWWPFLSK